MGQRLLSLALQDAQFRVTGGSARATSPWLGTDLGELIGQPPLGVPLQGSAHTALQGAEVALDFTSGEALAHNLEAALTHRVPLVVGTTGLSEAQHTQLIEASKTIPLLYSPNFSLGIALCLQVGNWLRQHAAAAHVQILDEHHVHKKDQPSGTARALADSLGTPHTAIRSIREGETIGTHTLTLTWDQERLHIQHEALSRDLFARGALETARALCTQPPGLYAFPLQKTTSASDHAGW